MRIPFFGSKKADDQAFKSKVAILYSDAEAFRKQLANRMGLNDSADLNILQRAAALQRCAVVLGEIRKRLAGIDWDNETMFRHEEDAQAVEDVLELLR